MPMTNFRILVWLIYGFASSVTAKYTKCFSKDDSDTICTAINITCPSGTLIYKPDIVASSDDCSDRNSFSDSRPCVGIPYDLTIEIAQCFWKPTCLVRFPAAPIFNSTAKLCPQPAKSLIVNTLRCIKTGTSKIYSDEICNKTLNGEIGPKAESGIIRSHAHLPWNYNELLCRIPDHSTTSCDVKIGNRLDNKTFTHIEVDFFDIDAEHDTLVIDKTSITKGITRNSYKPNSGVELKFTYNCDKSKSGSGFVICFKKTDETDENKSEKVSACKDLIVEEEGTVTMTTSPDEFCDDHFSLPEAIVINDLCTDSLEQPMTTLSPKTVAKKTLPTTLNRPKIISKTMKTEKTAKKRTKCDLVDLKLTKFCQKCQDSRGKCTKECRKCCRKICKAKKNQRERKRKKGRKKGKRKGKKSKKNRTKKHN